MTKPDKIAELFRANAHKLEQQPSEATWSRVQHRLAQSRPIAERRSVLRPDRRRRRVQSLSIAAGLLLLVGLSAVFLWVLNEQDRQYQRAVAASKRPLQVEDLPLAKEPLPSPIVQKSIEGVYHRPQKVIDEGRAEQKLVARATQPVPVQLPTSPAKSDSVDALNRTGR